MTISPQIKKITMIVAAVFAALMLMLSLYFSWAPATFDVQQRAQARVGQLTSVEGKLPTGAYTTSTIIEITDTLLNKRGGYIRNDIMPPGVWLDNIGNWEYGVVIQLRDMSKVMRESFSRSQSQSIEDVDLKEAEPLYSYNASRWMYPSTERRYAQAQLKVEAYLARLVDPAQQQAQFYARSDNLQSWLRTVESRLGSLSQRLSASVGKTRLNTDLANDPTASQATSAPVEQVVKTPWLKIDDVFYEARGASWALIHLLKAVEQDFGDLLDKKRARVSLQQIIRELEETQQTVYSPMILNGSGFGTVANHSLVMANYISRANAAMIDLRRLLEQG